MKKQTTKGRATGTTSTATALDPAAIERIESGKCRDTVQWVRGCATVTHSAGVGYVDGQLCRVEIAGDNIRSEKIGLRDAVKTMRELLVAEIALDLSILGDDDGLTRWLSDLESSNL